MSERHADSDTYWTAAELAPRAPGRPSEAGRTPPGVPERDAWLRRQLGLVVAPPEGA